MKTNLIILTLIYFIFFLELMSYFEQHLFWKTNYYLRICRFHKILMTL